MKNKYLLFVVLLLLMIFNALLLHKLFLVTKQRDSLYKTKLNESILMEEQLFYSTLMDENKIDLKGYSNIENPTLCYFASDIHCNSCVDSVFTIFCEYSSNWQNTVLLAKYKNKNDLNLFLRQHNFTGAIIDVSRIDNDIFKSEKPIMFIYHPDRCIASEFFRPNLSDIETSKKYLNIIAKKYLQD